MSVIPAIQHRKLMKALRDAGAIGKPNAKTLDEIGIKMTPNLKLHVASKQVLVDDDKYYLAENEE